MSIWSEIVRFLSYTEPMEQARTTDSFDDQLAAIQRTIVNPWRPASVGEALSVPAVFRAVTLISNTVGALSLEAFREGTKLAQKEAPRLITRPNPFSTPREFFRQTAWDMATMGEAFWWIAARDADDQPLSLFPMPAREVTISANERDPLTPRIEWRGRPMRNGDVRQVVFARWPEELRGVGPLQLCGAAVSVSVESQTWAANFFAEGGIPSVWIKSTLELDEDEAKALKRQWMEGANNVPRVSGPDIEDVKDFGLDPAKAQLTEARRYQRGEVATMFGIPASMLDHTEPGASLTYQNVGQEYDKFVRACLWPGYLEPIEQEISDLLTRSTVARFNIDGLLRPDVKTRYDVYNVGIPLGILSAEEARIREGLAPGDVENAPVPQSLPAAVPTSLPIARAEQQTEVRCSSMWASGGVMRPCNRRLGSVGPGPYSLYCQRCKTETEGVA